MADVKRLSCTLAVLGGGPGGYSAAFRAADLGLETILIEREATLGGVCLNAGCIPSKTLLHTAAVLEDAMALARQGIHFALPRIDLDALRAHKDQVIGRLTAGLASLAKARKVKVVRGTAEFSDSHTLQVALAGGDTLDVGFSQAIIAAGAEAIRLPFLPDDPRIVDSTGALLLREVPKRMLVIGGGIIGLELATVYSALGARIDLAEAADHVMPGADRDLVKVWMKRNEGRFERFMLSTRAVAADALSDSIRVRFEGSDAPVEGQYDSVLVAIGRRPNGNRIAAPAAGVSVSQQGVIATDRQMRTNVPHIFAIGDIAGAPLLAHKAVHEGHVAAEVAAGLRAVFDVRQIPSVAYTDPEIAWAGSTEDDLRATGREYTKALFPWSASGRAIANSRDEGLTKLLFDKNTHRLIGGAIAGRNAGDLIGEICLAIEMGADARDIGHTIHPHPTLSETVGLAAEVVEGVCTELMPVRSRVER